jgi:hypothetical protein
MDECSRLAEVSAGLAAVGNSPDDDFGGMYVVSTAHSVRRASASILEKSQSLPSTAYVDPCIKTCFNDSEVHAIVNAIDMLGWIETVDCPPGLISEANIKKCTVMAESELQEKPYIASAEAKGSENEYIDSDAKKSGSERTGDMTTADEPGLKSESADRKSHSRQKNGGDRMIRIPLTLYFAINTKYYCALKYFLKQRLP